MRPQPNDVGDGVFGEERELGHEDRGEALAMGLLVGRPGAGRGDLGAVCEENLVYFCVKGTVAVISSSCQWSKPKMRIALFVSASPSPSAQGLKRSIGAFTRMPSRVSRGR